MSLTLTGRDHDASDAEVTEGGTEPDHIRFLEPITEGQAELGTGIVIMGR